MKPKYQKIFDFLLQKINDNKFLCGEYLPSEASLMSEFNASRDTIRKTLNLLQSKGYIQKINGKGSVVLDKQPIELSFSGIRSFKEVVNSLPDTPIQTQLITFNEQINPITTPIINEFIKKIVASNPKEKSPEITFIERVRRINSERIILDEDYLNTKIVKGLTKKAAQESIYEFIENTLELTIGYAHREITVIPATQRDKELLDIGEFEFLICVTSYTYLEDTSLFQFTRSKHRPDKFKFIDFARRK